MSDEEMNDVLIVVFVAEHDQEYVARIAAQVSAKRSHYPLSSMYRLTINDQYFSIAHLIDRR